MKTILSALALVVALAVSAVAQMPTQEELRNVKTAPLSEIEKDGLKYDGKIIKIKFACRDKGVEKQADGSIKGVVWYWDRKEESGSADVTVPAEGIEWFMRISVDSMATRTVFAYARIRVSGASVTADLVGREIKTGLKGPELVW